MNVTATRFRSHITLALGAILHAFTHAYGTALVPLYLLIVADLRLSGVRAASLVVTIYSIVYCLGSYAAGVLADRYNRKVLLGVGLIGNAVAITAMGLTRQYEVLILLAVLAGMFGTLFHPAANALMPAHYPNSPGMAIGLLGMGSGLGFFFGPQYAGWRAQTAGWQRPCIEMGIAGMLVGILFLLIACEVRRSPDLCSHQRLGPTLRRKVIALAAVLGCRDFAGVASLSLLSIYLQKAHDYNARHTGFVLGAIMLLGVVVNPLAVYFSPGRRRLPALSASLILAGLIVSVVPLFAAAWILPLMCAFQAFQLGSYAISDAAILERVSPEIRGRVVGLFLTLAGTFASLSPWIMGFWTDTLGHRAHEPLPYLPIFMTLGAMMIVASFSTPLVAALGVVQGPRIEPLAETAPATLEVAG